MGTVPNYTYVCKLEVALAARKQSHVKDCNTPPIADCPCELLPASKPTLKNSLTRPITHSNAWAGSWWSPI